MSGVVSSEFSVQVAVEMPFDIRTIQSPSHELRIKVYTMKLHLFDLLLFWALCIEDSCNGYDRTGEGSTVG